MHDFWRVKKVLRFDNRSVSLTAGNLEEACHEQPFAQSK